MKITRQLTGEINPLGRFPPSRNFSVRTHVNFTRVNEIEAMYERSHVNVKVEPRSTFTLTSDLSCIASILFANVKVRTNACKNYATVEIHPKTISYKKAKRGVITFNSLYLLFIIYSMHGVPGH